MSLKKEEFLALTQGAMSVSEYRDKFLQLSRYCSEEVNTDPKKQYCFLKGLLIRSAPDRPSYRDGKHSSRNGGKEVQAEGTAV
ncbi:hypothetical protein U9M48_004753 [Paspalum notatum var. saurae]|uniref:Retrotransposon gag domain-containing protein n=1 Tax=Paspalum notatum var. saurae TaxID=547442 RepID=A0AAQ3SL13_PASNO